VPQEVLWPKLKQLGAAMHQSVVFARGICMSVAKLQGLALQDRQLSSCGALLEHSYERLTDRQCLSDRFDFSLVRLQGNVLLEHDDQDDDCNAW